MSTSGSCWADVGSKQAVWFFLFHRSKDTSEVRQLFAYRRPLALCWARTCWACVVAHNKHEMSGSTQLSQHDANLTPCFASGDILHIRHSATRIELLPRPRPKHDTPRQRKVFSAAHTDCRPTHHLVLLLVEVEARLTSQSQFSGQYHKKDVRLGAPRVQMCMAMTEPGMRHTNNKTPEISRSNVLDIA